MNSSSEERNLVWRAQDSFLLSFGLASMQIFVCMVISKHFQRLKVPSRNSSVNRERDQNKDIAFSGFYFKN